MFEREIYEVEKSRGEAEWLSNLLGWRKGVQFPGKMK